MKLHPEYTLMNGLSGNTLPPFGCWQGVKGLKYICDKEWQRNVLFFLVGEGGGRFASEVIFDNHLAS